MITCSLVWLATLSVGCRSLSLRVRPCPNEQQPPELIRRIFDSKCAGACYRPSGQLLLPASSRGSCCVRGKASPTRSGSKQRTLSLWCRELDGHCLAGSRAGRGLPASPHTQERLGYYASGACRRGSRGWRNFLHLGWRRAFSDGFVWWTAAQPTGGGIGGIASPYGPSDGRTRRCSEREPADSRRDKFNVIGGWLPSLSVVVRRKNLPCLSATYARRKSPMAKRGLSTGLRVSVRFHLGLLAALFNSFHRPWQNLCGTESELGRRVPCDDRGSLRRCTWRTVVQAARRGFRCGKFRGLDWWSDRESYGFSAMVGMARRAAPSPPEL